MANTLAHLLIAQKVLDLYPELVQNKNSYLFGSIAPDTIFSKQNAKKEDKKEVHLRDGIRDSEWLNEDKMIIFNDRINDFIKTNITPFNDSKFDFNIGYLVHLLTDEMNHRSIRQIMLRKVNKDGIKENDLEFFNLMVNDLEALDYFLLNNYAILNPLLEIILNCEVPENTNDLIKKEYIQNSVLWIKKHYLEAIKIRKLKYLSYLDIMDFIENASKAIVFKIKTMLNN